MVNENSISVIIPALNEEKNLTDAVATVSEAVKRRFKEYEILIFDDGSTDRTGEIAEMLANQDQHIKVIHHKKPECLGGVYKEGIKLAKMDYVILVNGKCDISKNELEKILSLKGKADIIIPYTINTGDRTIFRRTMSSVFVFLLNSIFRLRLKYYNHFVLHKREIVNLIDIRTNSYAFQAEVLIKLIKSGYSYIEVGVVDKFEENIKSKAFKPKNVFGLGLFLIRMIYEIYF